MITLLHSVRRYYLSILFLIFFSLLFGHSLEGSGQPTPGFNTTAQTASYELDGDVGWVFRYGFGDGRGFTNPDHSLGFFFNQQIQLDAKVNTEIDQPTAGILELSAQLDNSKPDFLQNVGMIFEADNWNAEFGDFPMGRAGSPFAVSSRQLKGFRLNWFLSDRVTISGIYSQVAGNVEVKVFRGSTVESSITYAYYPPDQPFVEKPYSSNLDGLEYFELGPSYVEGFSTVNVSFLVDNALRDLLNQYELEYLFDPIGFSPEQELEPDVYYTVIPAEDEYFLALRTKYIDILRELIFELIDEYNENSGLPVDEWQDYPFYQDTEFEREFLEQLSRQTEIRVDQQIFDPSESQNRRFYALPAKEIVEETLVVEVLIDEEFLSVEDPTLIGYEANLYSEIGILEFNFPQIFFEERDNAVRVQYSYDQASADSYVLGTNVLHNSEKVFLNDRLLQRDVDYFVLFESQPPLEFALLILLASLGEDDVLRIEYEVARSGFGGSGPFGRSFTALNLQGEPFDGFTLNVDLMQAHDSLRDGLDIVGLQTMPNTHTVLGVSGVFTNDILDGNFDIGVSQNLFPPDNNLRVNQPNEINVIKVLEIDGHELVLFGHRNGFHLFDGVTWSKFGTQEGLLGQEVYDIEYANNTIYLGTSGGLTTISLSAGSPVPSFARKRSWVSFDERDGIPGTNVRAVLVDGNRIWVGTDQALGTVELSQMTDFEQWTYYQRADYPEIPSDRIRHIERLNSTIYVGTDQGLFAIDGRTENVVSIPNLQSLNINDMLVANEILYVATERGVFEVRGFQGARSLISDEAVNSIAWYNGEVWYATDQGLAGVVSGRVRVTNGRPIAALAAAVDAVWAGERANAEDMKLFLYRVVRPSDYRLYQDVETRLDGRTANRYQDIPKQGHRDHGVFGRLVLNKRLGDLSLQGSIEGVTPQFSPVGALNRQDHLRLSMSGVYPVAPGVQLRAVHEEGLYGLYDEPTINISDIVNFDLAPSNSSTEISVSSTLRHSDADFETEGFDRQDHLFEISIGQSFLNDLMNVNVGFDRDESENFSRPLYSSRGSELWGQLQVRPLPGLTLGSGYRLPSELRFGQLSQRHRINWSASWSKAFPFIGFTLRTDSNYNGNLSIPIGPTRDDSRSLSHIGSASVGINSVRVGDLRVRPDVSFSGRLVDPLKSTSVVDLSGTANLEFDLSAFDGEVSFTKSYLNQQRNELTTHRDGINLFLRYLGFADIDPSISFTGSINTLIHPLFGHKDDGNYSVATGLTWRSAGPFSADITISRDFRQSGEDQRTILSLVQELRYRVSPQFQPNVRMSFDYVSGLDFGEIVDTLNGSISLGASVQVFEGWSARFSTLVLFGLDSINERENTSSYLFEFDIGGGLLDLLPMIESN